MRSALIVVFAAAALALVSVDAFVLGRFPVSACSRTLIGACKSPRHFRRFAAAALPSAELETSGKKSGGVVAYLKQRRAAVVEEFKANPWTFISIPLVAAAVGWITNYVGVQMLFYPISWVGIPIVPRLGLIGWQGVVPAKRHEMAGRMVDVTISRLLKVSEVFLQLQPKRLAELLAPTVTASFLNGWMPSFVVRLFLRRTAKDLLLNIEKVVDVKKIVVTGMTTDPTVLGSFFQKVGAKELKFLVDSGFGFGFLLGLIQMVQWMVFPRNWTLVVGGAVVGFITNWIALKWIFEPLLPTKVGPFVLQGMFLKRQVEVSNDFSAYIADNVLTSVNVWRSIFEESKPLQEFRSILHRNVPLPQRMISSIIDACRSQIGRSPLHPVHDYTNLRLNLKATLTERMNKLTPQEFEQVLHPIFQEDELTLILAGAVLGAAAGFLQMLLNIQQERANAKEQQRKRKTAA